MNGRTQFRVLMTVRGSLTERVFIEDDGDYKKAKRRAVEEACEEHGVTENDVVIIAVIHI